MLELARFIGIIKEQINHYCNNLTLASKSRLGNILVVTTDLSAPRRLFEIKGGIWKN